MLSSLSTINSIAKFSKGTVVPSGPTQSYGGAFTNSIQHTAPAGSKYLQVQTAQYLGAGKWTIEFWVYIPSTTGIGIGLFGNRYTFGGVTNSTLPRLNCWFNFGSNTQTISLFNINAPTASSGQFLQTGTVPTNQWVHIAFTRDSGNTCRSFVNGVLQANTRSWGQDFSTQNEWAIGRAYQDLNQEYLNANGCITGFSMSKECYYTTTFTPTKQRLNNDATKILLLNFTNSTLTDSSSSNNTVTNTSMGFSTSVPV